MKRTSSLLQYTILFCFLGIILFLIYLSNDNFTFTNIINSDEESSSEDTVETHTIVITSDEDDEEMKGVWISYINLQASSEDEFKEQYLEMLNQAYELGLNAVFVHVRAFGDSLYDSEIYPWSHIISGTQGVEPSFDPLEFMIEEAHNLGIEFHAWINPLRIQISETPSELSSDNLYSQLSVSNPYYFIETDSGIYLNPSYSYVRDLIVDGVVEIVENYDVDGIHFDDYFYPYDIESQDQLGYTYYCDSADYPLSISEWRTANINTLISEVYRNIKLADESVVFGISPQGNITNNESLCADVYEWCATFGYIDYICPQIYFSYDNPSLGFTEVLETWTELEMHSGVDVYIGLALYKVGTDNDDGTWSEDFSMIEMQIADTQEIGTGGYILYDIASLEDYLVFSNP